MRRVFFSLREKARLCYLQILLPMRYTPAIVAILVVCVFLGYRLSFADSAPSGEENKAASVEASSDATEGELPDDPLGRQSTGKEGIQKRHDAELLPSLNSALTQKVKNAVEAIRDALLNPMVLPGSDIPVVYNESVDRHIRSFTGPKRDSFARWLVRANKYEPTIRRILKKNDLPEDLVYVAMIESGFNMKACSRANAMGPWQFMDETGRQYGLRVDYWVDERYDLEKSTVAAARYLKKLFDQFGCWYLAAAGYNAGENRVKRAMENGGTKDFWQLREYNVLPRETQEYVPQLIAAAIIAKDPERYGFFGTRSSPVHRLTTVGIPGGVPLGDIARSVPVDLADLRALNPELLQGITPPDARRYQINLPATRKAQLFSAKAKKGLTWERQVVRVVHHRIKAKDTVRAIERRYRLTRSDLSLVNAGGLEIQEGQTIYVPRFSGDRKDVRPPSTTRPRLARATQGSRKTPSSLSTNKPGNAGARTAAINSDPKQGRKAGPATKTLQAADKRNPAKRANRKLVRLD